LTHFVLGVVARVAGLLQSFWLFDDQRLLDNLWEAAPGGEAYAGYSVVVHTQRLSYRNYIAGGEGLVRVLY